MLKPACGWVVGGRYEHRAGCDRRHPAFPVKMIKTFRLADGREVAERPRPTVERAHPDPVENDNLVCCYRGPGGTFPVRASVAVRATGSMPRRLAIAKAGRRANKEPAKTDLMGRPLPPLQTVPRKRGRRRCRPTGKVVRRPVVVVRVGTRLVTITPSRKLPLCSCGSNDVATHSDERRSCRKCGRWVVGKLETHVADLETQPFEKT